MQVAMLLEQVREELAERANALAHTERKALELGNEVLAYASRFWRNKIMDIYVKLGELSDHINNTIIVYEIEACSIANSIYKTLIFMRESREKFLTEPLKKPLLDAYRIVRSLCKE